MNYKRRKVKMGSNYDFSGWATKSNVLCADGRTILPNAFKDNDKTTVPLVWMHNHNDPENVLGHALLENRDDGLWAYGFFNETPKGKLAKSLVQHGDVEMLSIYANQLKETNGNVQHGNVREVSLVLASANPEAYIENVLQHDGIVDMEQAIITSGELVEYDCENSKLDDELKHSDDTKEEKEKDMADSERTVEDVVNTFTDEQQKVVEFLIGTAVQAALENAGQSNTENGGNEEMKHNAFETDTNENTLAHDAMETIIGDAKRFGSMKESFLQHAAEYGIDNIEYLFPTEKNITDTPGFIKRTPSEWVSTVMSGVHHTPFSRIKMMFADITADEARAKGYTKGNRKVEEVFSLLKRTVDPTTIYKKQKMDRDDVIDITDFDVISWLKTEMRMMLDEEIARAILFGDGRLVSSDDHIDATKIIPIIADDSLYTISTEVTQGSDESIESAIIKAAVLSKINYQGSGNLTAYMKPEIVARMLLLEDGFKHRLYKDTNELALAMGVKRIVEVPASVVPSDVYALIVDLNDYNVGADKGGAINMFDDFDIDYNQQKYLIETRCSGALVKPYSAIVLKAASSNPSQS